MNHQLGSLPQHGEAGKPGAAQSVPEDGEAAAPVIGQAKRPAAELGPQRPVLLEQVGEGISLALVEPGRQREAEPAQGRRIEHAGENSPKMPPLLGSAD